MRVKTFFLSAVPFLALAGNVGEVVQQSTIILNTSPPTPSKSKWSHGTFVFRTFSAADGRPFYVFDRSGTQIGTVRVNVPQSDQIQVEGFDRGSSGLFAACGAAYSEGRAAYYIFLVRPDGASQLVRTNPYWPQMIAVADDNTIWTVGSEVSGSDRGGVEGSDPNAPVVRHFDDTGKFIAGLAPRSKFGLLRLSDGLLVAGKDRIGWLGPTKGNVQYLEISLDGKSIRPYGGLPRSAQGKNVKVTDLAIADDGSAYVNVAMLPSWTNAVYVLDRNALDWIPVSVGSSTSGVRRLLGTDGNSSVFAGAKENQFYFFAQR